MAARVSDGNGSFFESAIDFSSISAWDRYRSYSLNELVSYNGNLYLSNAGSGNSARTPGVHPYWTLQGRRHDRNLLESHRLENPTGWRILGSLPFTLRQPFVYFGCQRYASHRNTFDYESNATSYIIRVQVRDEHNASLDHNFTVSLNELYEPSRSNHLVDLNSTVKLEMIWVEPGTFTMGRDLPHSAYGSSGYPDKGILSRKHEVTTAQYEAVMVGKPGRFVDNSKQPSQPQWTGCRSFLGACSSFSIQVEQSKFGQHTPGWKYALPTEAEWEYACRAGSTTSYFWGNQSIPAKANSAESGYGKAITVGSYHPNNWGFYDMHGNVREWTPDWDVAYTSSHQIDPTGAVSGTRRINRGGAWISPSSHVTLFSRNSSYPNFASGAVGFRLAFKKVTSFPTDLNSTAPLTIAENQPVGTFVGQFTAHDPDANASLSYRLANGPGSQHNNRFSLDANGTLRTAKVFDYENRTIFKIRVQVADEHNASIQEAFIVSVTDLVSPPRRQRNATGC